MKTSFLILYNVGVQMRWRAQADSMAPFRREDVMMLPCAAAEKQGFARQGFPASFPPQSTEHFLGM